MKRIVSLLVALIMMLSFTALMENAVVTFVVDGEETEVTAQDGKVALPEDPELEGYSFIGWFTAPEGGQPFDADNVTESVTVWAQFNEAKEYFFKYDWEEEDWDGSRPFEDGEGNNFLLMDGKAHTIDNKGHIGPCDSWSFTYGPYDQGIGECTVEVKVNCLGHKVEGAQGVFSIRHMYATNYDVQVNFATDSAKSGVYLYNVNNGALIASSHDPENGGVGSESVIATGEDHVIKIVYDYNDDDSTTKLLVYVDDNLELSVPSIARQSVNAKFGFGASQGTNLEVDYFYCYPTK